MKQISFYILCVCSILLVCYSCTKDSISTDDVALQKNAQLQFNDEISALKNKPVDPHDWVEDFDDCQCFMSVISIENASLDNDGFWSIFDATPGTTPYFEINGVQLTPGIFT
ncbi:MAG: hypothetical protein DA408_00650 [Bacteroidetes bacterium]|nr:MAG: hypothetical protein C7N36_03285 [Bacteroidota bacterium]PTM15162.1 MAG: hypothetical protein DA408_00650 [Bacteroidota bacterium]